MALILDKDIAVISRSFGSFVRTTECESRVQVLRTNKEDRRGAVTYPMSQNINGGKAGPRALRTFRLFPGASMYS